MLKKVENSYYVEIPYGTSFFMSGNGGWLELGDALILWRTNNKVSYSPSGVYELNIDRKKLRRISKKDMVEWLKKYDIDKADFYQKNF